MTSQNGGGPVFPLLTFADLEHLPDPPWLIHGLMPGNGLSVLYGPAACGKSFLALDWALSVATGTEWFGRTVEQRPVVYIAAEGAAGLGKRVRAWRDAHAGAVVRDIWWLPEAVNLLEPRQVDRARRTFAELSARPGLVVVDTAARTMAGGDENASKDVGRFIAAIDLLRETDAGLVVHHTGKDGASERGSSALRGAADLMVRAERTGRKVKLGCDKLKDAAEWPPLTVVLEPSGGSCVLSLSADAEDIDDVPARVLAYIAEHAPISGKKIEENVRGSAANIREALKAHERAGTAGRGDDGWTLVPADETRPDERDEGRSVAPSSHRGEEDVVLPGGDEAHAQAPSSSSEPASDDLNDLAPEDLDLVARAERLIADNPDLATQSGGTW